MVRKMLGAAVATAVVLGSGLASATTYHTLEINWVGIRGNGTAFFSIKGGQPVGSDPSWQACPSNSVYFHKFYNGSDFVPVDPEVKQSMLSVGMAAYLSGNKVRVGIDRDSAGACYTNQMFFYQ